MFDTNSILLASGKSSKFKIECDDLTDQDLATMARIVAPALIPFSKVVGVPRGGLRFAEALAPYASKFSCATLFADDVFTTGGSLRRYAHEYGIRNIERCQAVVIFARNPPPDWVFPIFQLNDALRHS